MLADEEKVRARHHMGYVNVGAIQTFILGTPAAIQTQFMIEGAFDKVLPAAEPLFRKILTTLDTIETQMLEDMELLAITKLDTIEVRPDEFKQLTNQYEHWRRALGNIMGVPPNPFDQRFGGLGGGSGGVNVRVQH